MTAQDRGTGSGEPLGFAEPLHVGRPNIGDRDRLHQRLDEVLDRRWLTNDGPLVREFEQRVAAEAGVRHCVAVCNATVGLQVLARALQLEGEVIVPAYTFVATAHALSWIGLTPVFCDVDPVTHMLDPASVERLITGRTSAVVGVHLWGGVCDVSALSALAARHGIALVLDAAHAFGCATAAGPVGSFGLAEVFSFHATKFVNAFEGGAVVTDDDALAERLRLGRNFGFADYDTVSALGTNAKMSELSAAMGLTSLEAMHVFVRRNQANAAAYRAGLDGVAGLRLLDHRGQLRSNHQYVVVEVDEDVTGVPRDEVLRFLHAHGVLARRYFHPGCHRSEPYRSEADLPPPLPVTERLCRSVLVLPTGTAVTEVEVGRVCELVRGAVT